MYVKLPPGDEEEGKCGLLIKSLPGTRDAAQIERNHSLVEFWGTFFAEYEEGAIRSVAVGNHVYVFRARHIFAR